MSPAAEVRVGLARLLAETADDLEVAGKRASELAAVLADARAWTDDAPQLAVAALSLHHYYSAVESCLERVIRVFEGKLPEAADRHRELLRLAALAIPTVREAVVSRGSERVLAELMRFRHFLRHAYAADLVPARLRVLAEMVVSGHDRITEEIEAFRAGVVRRMDALEAAERGDGD